MIDPEALKVTLARKKIADARVRGTCPRPSIAALFSQRVGDADGGQIGKGSAVLVG